MTDEFTEVPGPSASDDPNRGPGFRVRHIWAVLAVDPKDNAEGVPAASAFIEGQHVLLPLIASDEARLKHIREMGARVGREGRQRMVLVKFSVREDLEVLFEP